MKLIIIAIIFTASSLIMLSATNKGDNAMFIENESKYGFNETVDKINAELLKNDWRISATHDLQETMKKNDKVVLPVKVIETCKPSHSYKILVLDDERVAASMMPCRISVYEKSDGKTYISRMNAKILAKQIGGIIDEVMTDAFVEIEDMINKFVK